MFFNLQNDYHNTYGISVLTNVQHAGWVADYECALLIGTPRKYIVLTQYICSCDNEYEVSEVMENIQKLTSFDKIFGDIEPDKSQKYCNANNLNKGHKMTEQKTYWVIKLENGSYYHHASLNDNCRWTNLDNAFTFENKEDAQDVINNVDFYDLKNTNNSNNPFNQRDIR